MAGKSKMEDDEDEDDSEETGGEGDRDVSCVLRLVSECFRTFEKTAEIVMINMKKRLKTTYFIANKQGF